MLSLQHHQRRHFITPRGRLEKKCEWILHRQGFKGVSPLWMRHLMLLYGEGRETGGNCTRHFLFVFGVRKQRGWLFLPSVERLSETAKQLPATAGAGPGVTMGSRLGKQVDGLKSPCIAGGFFALLWRKGWDKGPRLYG